MSRQSESCIVASPKGCNHATIGGGPATPPATDHATLSLKDLAHKVLERNARRNSDATQAKNQCNFQLPNTPSKLHQSGETARLIDRACIGLETTSNEVCSNLLDPVDFEDIQQGIITYDQLRLYIALWLKDGKLWPL